MSETLTTGHLPMEAVHADDERSQLVPAVVSRFAVA